MAAGDRDHKGKATDYVRHAEYHGKPACGVKNYGYLDHQWTDVTCKKCLIKIRRGKIRI